MKKLISRRKFLAAMGTMVAAGALTACGGSSSSTASSAAASSTAASAAESWGDVKLTMWGAEEDQTMLREMQMPLSSRMRTRQRDHRDRRAV